jgi:hypothetical protein
MKIDIILVSISYFCFLVLIYMSMRILLKLYDIEHKLIYETQI